MNLFWFVLAVLLTTQIGIFLINGSVLKKANMDEQFYRQKDLDGKRDSVYQSYAISVSSYRSDSTSRAIITENLINHIVPEGKDLSKSFLTLLVAVLVAGITFGDKVVQFPTARLSAKAFIISSWISLCIAIVLSGLGIIYLMLCEGEALNMTLVHQKLYRWYFANNYNKPQYLDALNNCIRWFFHSGMTFCFALFALMIAGIISNIYPPQLKQTAPETTTALEETK